MAGGERGTIPAEARLADDADWSAEPVDLAAVGEPLERFSWLSPRTLWRSRNNVLASLSGDPTENARLAWVHERRAALRAAGADRALLDDFMLTRDQLAEFSFMVIGDTGEGDRSQYSVVPALLAAAAGSEFAVIASDVVYPAGDVNDYVEKFFIPYAGYPRPIYGVPGNHDWLDGLAGFMRHFCGQAPPRGKFRPPPGARWTRTALLAHRLMWRRPRALRPETLARAEQLRGAADASGPSQPNMYFCIDTPHLRIVTIDTGILGRLDHAQGRWLARVSAGPKPKLLISGKPIYSGADMSPRRILAGAGPDGGRPGLLWPLISDPRNNYVAMISGDVHHYERHSVGLPDGRRIQCLIAGGGGAFMGSTHQIGRVARPEVDEDSWTVYPTRGDSLRAYSISLQRRLRRPVRGIPADEAAAIVAERHGLELAGELARGAGGGDPAAVQVSRRSRMLARAVFPRRGWYPPEKVSESLDWDDPPLFKNFVRVDAGPGRLTLTAFGVTGLQRDAGGPAVIDRVEIATAPDGGDR
jgi:hypothetical protein